MTKSDDEIPDIGTTKIPKRRKLKYVHRRPRSKKKKKKGGGRRH